MIHGKVKKIRGAGIWLDSMLKGKGVMKMRMRLERI
jgi:hypothetical protein